MALTRALHFPTVASGRSCPGELVSARYYRPLIQDFLTVCMQGNFASIFVICRFLKKIVFKKNHKNTEIYGKVYTSDSLLETVLYWGINCIIRALTESNILNPANVLLGLTQMSKLLEKVF